MKKPTAFLRPAGPPVQRAIRECRRFEIGTLKTRQRPMNGQGFIAAGWADQPKPPGQHPVDHA
jgi:hypothetical protein